MPSADKETMELYLLHMGFLNKKKKIANSKYVSHVRKTIKKNKENAEDNAKTLDALKHFMKWSLFDEQGNGEYLLSPAHVA